MLNLHKMPAWQFCENFLWGSATAGHQIEGNNCNAQNYHNEINHPENHKEPSGRACNSWEMFEEDVKLLVSLGHRAYRFSIEWSRLQPREDAYDFEALQRYLNLIERLKENGIHVAVTLHHFTHPQWFALKDGFASANNLDLWKRYLDFIVPKIAPYVDSWCVMNEFNGSQLLTPVELDRKANQLKAHAIGYRVIKAFSSAPVSSAHALSPRVPLRAYDVFDKTLSDFQDWMINEFFFHGVRTGEIVLPFREAEYMPELKGSADYWAVNYYHRGIVDARKANGFAKKFAFNRFMMIDIPDWQREICPEYLITALARLKDLPVWITENGVCCDDDRFRIIYLMQHLEAIKEAIKLHGIDLRAYFHWSLMDNYEWSTYAPRFGLSSVDRTTFARTPKPSAWFYKKVIENNGMSGNLFAEFMPDLPQFHLYPYYQ